MNVRPLHAVALLGLMGIWSASAGAVEFKHIEPTFVPVHNCTCRFYGENVPLGEVRCLVTPNGTRTAQCVLEQNVTSWSTLIDACPQASLDRPPG